MTKLSVLVACEFSGTVRDAFLAAGHDAISCDLLPTESPGPHYEGDVFDIINDGFDLMVAHPPCTYLTNSGVRWLGSEKERWKDLIDGAVFFRDLLDADIPHIAIENPVMHKYAAKIIGERQAQVVQPWMFGHPETKGVGLWLRDLPKLVGTDNVKAQMDALPYAERAKVHSASPGPNRWKVRSRFFTGIAGAMADQWPAHILGLSAPSEQAIA